MLEHSAQKPGISDVREFTHGGEAPGRQAVVSCTLLPYDKALEMGATLTEAAHAVKLNHRHCARFCVLGGA
jgi:hypothetical protein